MTKEIWATMSHMERMKYLNCKPIPLYPLTDLGIKKWNEEHDINGSQCDKEDIFI